MKVKLTPAEQYLIEDALFHLVEGYDDQEGDYTLADKVIAARNRRPEMSCISITVNAVEFDYLRHLFGVRWDGGRPSGRRK